MPPAPHPSRLLGVDLARGIALVSMFVAHTAPSAGPGGVLQLSEHLTFPLFALLVGAGSQLAARGASPLEHLARVLAQASALLALGWALGQAGAQVVIVLAHLGVLTLITWVLVRLPSAVLPLVVLGAVAVAPWTLESAQVPRAELAVEQSPVLWWFDLLVSQSYPQAVLVACAGVGVLAVRLLTDRAGTLVQRSAWTSVTTLGLAALLLAADARGNVDLVAYSTDTVEIVFVLLLATGVLSGSLALARVGVRWWQLLVRALAQAGAMTLTLYSLHILWLAYWVRVLHPGERDDTWVNVLGMTTAAVVLALAWNLLRLPGAWRRGPVEGVVGTASRWAVRRVARGDAPAREPRPTASTSV